MDYGPVKDFDQRSLDRSLSPAVGFLASHPVYGNLSVNSGRRSKASNRKARGAKKSQHLLGKALDLDVSRLSNAQKAQLLSDLASYGIKGIGIYAGGQTIHIDARKNFATWGPNPKDKYAGVEISQQPKWARQALTAIQQAGPYKAFPAAPAAVPGTASLAIGPAGTSLADAYRTAQYQRAMPEGPTPPATAPVPSSRPLDSIGGLGAAYQQAKQGRVAPSSQIAPVGERFGTRPSLASLSQPSRFGAVTAQDDLAMQAQPQSPPMGVVSGPLGPAPQSRMPDQSQRFRPDAAPAAVPTPTARPDYASPQQRMAGVAPPSATVSNMLAGRNMPVSPAPAAQMAVPAAVATAAPAPTAPAPSRFGPQVPVTAPISQVANTPMAPQPSSPPIGAVNAPFGPANAPPVALDAARNLGTAMAAAAPEMATPATLAEKVSQPQPRQVAAAQPVAKTTQQRPAGGIPAGVAGPWAADISMQQQPAVDRMTTQSTAAPTTFGEKLTNAAQRYGPQIAGTLLGGPVGGLIGGLLGRSFDAAKPGQVFGNPFQGLGNTAKAMGMFQSGTPYSGPISNYGTGLKAIGDVLGGAAPIGARAYSRSTPGYSVTSLPNGMIQRTNQYGFTSFEKAPGFSGPGVFSGGFFGGKTSGGKTSGGRTSSGRTSGGTGGSGRSASASHSKSTRF